MVGCAEQRGGEGEGEEGEGCCCEERVGAGCEGVGFCCEDLGLEGGG